MMRKKDWVKYIKTNVTMLYHETESEPIAEFLNINENKTRFVISDYIRAKMISDNPVDNESLSKKEIEKHKKIVIRFLIYLVNYLSIYIQRGMKKYGI